MAGRPVQAPAEGSRHGDFEFAVAAIYREWTGGRLTEEAAMEALGNALTELREQGDDQ
jgi:hypothetical protein